MPEDREPQEAPRLLMAPRWRRPHAIGPRNPCCFLGQNRGVTALLAVVILGILFTPARCQRPLSGERDLGHAEPCRTQTAPGTRRFSTRSTRRSLRMRHCRLLAVGMNLVIRPPASICRSAQCWGSRRWHSPTC